MFRFPVFLFVLVAVVTKVAFSERSAFLRIDEDTREVQLAFKTYENDDGKKVTIMAMFHMGDPEFYRQASKKMKDLTVLYESVGLSLAEKEQLHRRVNDLGGVFEQINITPELSSIFMSPDWLSAAAIAFGLVNQQDHLKYDRAKEVIHADIKTDVTPDLSEIDDEVLRSRLRNNVSILVRIVPDLCKLTSKLCFSLVKASLKLIGTKEVFFREAVKSHLNIDDDEEFTERNEIAINKLEALIDDEENSDHLAIVYGAKHSPVFEEFLTEQKGFILTDVEWLTLTSLDYSLD